MIVTPLAGASLIADTCLTPTRCPTNVSDPPIGQVS